MKEEYQEPRTTNLALSAELRRRIEESAISDSRRMKAQTLVLIEEALDARDKKAARK